MSAADHTRTLASRTGKPPALWLAAGSLWLLLPLLGIGFLGWAGFLIIGLLARRAAWLSAAGLYLVVLLVSLAMNPEAGGTARTLLWTISSLHALGINPAWLRNRWELATRSSGPALAALIRRAPADVGTETTTARPTARAIFGRRSRTAAARPAGTAPAPRPAGNAAELLDDPGLDATSYYAGPAQSPAAGPSRSPADPVDVNSASAVALQKLNGISRHKARKAIRLRNERGPFRSVEDFGAALGISQPDLVVLRPHLVCKLPPARPVSFGRSVDY
ncbi:ComEA family DNA-binding protein [Arthrobacter sulfonylureivorans]|uniref:ComEA family DNA-binding protein n=1 Tax=Arthrobacter sulfonylureivorans TaxID=2486855 RepID=UPI0039E55C68